MDVWVSGEMWKMEKQLGPVFYGYATIKEFPSNYVLIGRSQSDIELSKIKYIHYSK
jgi:hypothetical protein